ncbi:hypothetical protein C9374_002189 [Naegleria lovaniensis]|uniref:BTB domain-containing protein n=1 Tax=Naegleria lovaniensis TaxID=51637 RepID=A0AA88GT84_NAELO|nr:uncharacterized protein C9374_002189 [Naegleria lovaniensis]KAG2386445.1 hypothetical protein C9374_002189 [Naegleria lovaniensis]
MKQHEDLPITCVNLFKLFNNEQFSDFKIKLPHSQQVLSVSKGILAMNSEYFSTLFQPLQHQQLSNTSQLDQQPFKEHIEQELEITGGAT